ncbi:hypothetical protein BKA81DRAFT_350354 [Phyllosticta paracitricarpa]
MSKLRLAVAAPGSSGTSVWSSAAVKREKSAEVAAKCAVPSTVLTPKPFATTFGSSRLSRVQCQRQAVPWIKTLDHPWKYKSHTTVFVRNRKLRNLVDVDL